MADDLPPPSQLMSMVRLRERHSDLMRDYGRFDDEPTPEFIARIIAFQADASAAGAGISSSDERFEAQSKINYWQTARINAGQRPDTVLLAAFDRALAKRQDGNRSPYKGLAPFLIGDSKFFAGRYELVGKLVANVKKVRLLALLGLSGSGKSSVIRAGLIPDLKDGAYDGIDDDGLTDSSFWKYPDPILPGADPMAALEDVYGTITTAADLPVALDRLGNAVVLSIDQFEEVFTLSPTSELDARRTLFLDALVAAATTGSYRHVVVITMRSEYDIFVAKHPAFSALFSAGREVVQAMQASDLRKVIEEPASRLGVGFEPGLVDELMTRVQGEPAGLPLLSFTLLKLWDMRADGPMKMADYQALGGNPRDILANSADKVVEGFLTQDQDLAQGIFTRLVTIGDSLEATSMRTKRSDLPGARDNVNRVLAILVDEGLLRSSPPPPDRAATVAPDAQHALDGAWITPETQFEVAHEALIRNWSRLTHWVKDSFAEQTNRKAFTLRAQNWKDKKGDLLSGLSLDEARNFPDKSLVEIEYIAASQLHEQAQQRKRFWVTAAFAVMALLLAVALVRLIMIGREREAGRHSDALFAAAETLVDRGEVPLAHKVLRESVDAADPQPAFVRAVLTAVAPLANMIRPDLVATGDALPPRVQALLQAVRLNSLGQRPALRIADPAAPTDKPARPIDATIDSSGMVLLSLWDDGIARAWIRAGDESDFIHAPLELKVPGRRIVNIALAPDGNSAISASYDDIRGITYFDIWTFDPKYIDVNPGRKSQIVYNIDANDIVNIQYYPSDPNKPVSSKIMMSLNYGSYLEFDVKTKAIDITDPTTSGDVSISIYSPKGDKILSAYHDGSVTIVDAKTRKQDPYIGVVEGSKSPVTAARFNPTGERFAIGSMDGIIRVYRSSDNQKLYELTGHRKGITELAFSPDGATLVSSSKDSTLRFWDFGVEAGRLRRSLAISDAADPKPVNSVTYTADGERIVVASDDGSIRILDVNGNKLKAPVPVGTQSGFYLPVSIAVSDDRGTMVTQTVTGDDQASAQKADYEAFDLKTGKLQTKWSGVTSQFDNSQLSADGSTFVAILSNDGSHVVKAKTMAPGFAAATVATVATPDPPVVAVAPDGKAIVVVESSGVITVHDGRDWSNAKALAAFDPKALGSSPALHAFSKQGRLFALAAQRDPIVLVYDLTTGRNIARIQTASAASAVEFSGDGTGLFIGTEAGSGAIYGAHDGNLRHRLAGRQDGGISFARFSGTGTTLVTGSTDATARLWNAETGEKLPILRGHTATVSGASFAATGDRLLTESDDRTVRLWDSKTGRQLTVLRGAAGTGALWGRFADDGTVQTVSRNPPERRSWNVGVPSYRYDDLRALACKDNGGKITTEERERNSLPPALPPPACAAAAAVK